MLDADILAEAGEQLEKAEERIAELQEELLQAYETDLELLVEAGEQLRQAQERIAALTALLEWIGNGESRTARLEWLRNETNTTSLTVECVLRWSGEEICVEAIELREAVCAALEKWGRGQMWEEPNDEAA